MGNYQNNEEKTISSDKYTLNELVQKHYIFNIPIYQRLYVWKSNQIETLLEDLCHSYVQKENGYYLGGIMITRHKNYSGNFFKYDIIDGQQRFTTLWLISRYLGNVLDDFKYYHEDNDSHSRISFSVRDFADEFFKNSNKTFGEDEEKELKALRDGIKTIESFFNSVACPISPQQYDEFATFIFSKIYFIVTQMPEDVDENKVFEAMNNRGVQLQQHEILKSQILKNIKNDYVRSKYAILWDSCSQMEKYLEKSIKDVADLKWIQLFNSNQEDTIVSLPRDILSILKNESEDDTEIKLIDILNSTELDSEEARQLSHQSSDDENYESTSVRSVINFPMLLLHTLRIYQNRRNKITEDEQIAEVNAKELIAIFNKNYALNPEVDHFFMIDSEEDALCFIELLWKVREVFDRYIIKWVKVDEGARQEDYHQILTLYQTKTALQRRFTKANDELALLQSILYHSQQLTTHYWLTPFLSFLLEDHNPQSILLYLKKLDNEMFCNPRRDLRTMSYKLQFTNMEDLKGNSEFIESELKKTQGVTFPHYFFYKLEFILWSERNRLFSEYNIQALNFDMWDNFYMTAKNSIEHIFPQNPKEENKDLIYISALDKINLEKAEDENFSPINDFGNLVLLTSGINSSYSNKSFGEKKHQFMNNRRKMDSLKSSIIFYNDSWNWTHVQEHRNKMIIIFKDYIDKLKTN